MTRNEALSAAARIFAKIENFVPSGIPDKAEAQARYLQAQAEAGRGLVELARELRA